MWALRLGRCSPGLPGVLSTLDAILGWFVRIKAFHRRSCVALGSASAETREPQFDMGSVIFFHSSTVMVRSPRRGSIHSCTYYHHEGQLIILHRIYGVSYPQPQPSRYLYAKTLRKFYLLRQGNTCSRPTEHE